LADVFREPRNRYVALRFVLNAIDATENRRLTGCATAGRYESRHGVQPDGRCRFCFMRERNFNAIGMAAEGDIQSRMFFGQRREGLLASGDYRFLELRGSVIFQAGNVPEIARNTANRSRKSGVCVDIQTNRL